MSDMPLYTLPEAQRELAWRQCVATGHSWVFINAHTGDPVRVTCDHCGWSGDVTMGPRP